MTSLSTTKLLKTALKMKMQFYQIVLKPESAEVKTDVISIGYTYKNLCIKMLYTLQMKGILQIFSIGPIRLMWYFHHASETIIREDQIEFLDPKSKHPCIFSMHDRDNNIHIPSMVIKYTYERLPLT